MLSSRLVVAVVVVLPYFFAVLVCVIFEILKAPFAIYRIKKSMSRLACLCELARRARSKSGWAQADLNLRLITFEPKFGGRNSDVRSPNF